MNFSVYIETLICKLNKNCMMSLIDFVQGQLQLTEPRSRLHASNLSKNSQSMYIRQQSMVVLSLVDKCTDNKSHRLS